MAMKIILWVQLIQATKFGWSHITEMTEHMFLATGEIVRNAAFMEVNSRAKQTSSATPSIKSYVDNKAALKNLPAGI